MDDPYRIHNTYTEAETGGETEKSKEVEREKGKRLIDRQKIPVDRQTGRETYTERDINRERNKQRET